MLSQFPVWWANVATVILFIVLAVIVMYIPKQTIVHDAPDEARWRDVRWWALLLIAVQLGIYAIFS